MRHARAVEIDILQFVSGLRRAAFIEPLISLCGMLRQSAADQKGGAGDDRGIQALATWAVQTENVEAQVANLFTSLPFEKNAAALPWHGAERGQLNGSRRGNGRGYGRSVVGEIGVPGGCGYRRSVSGKRRSVKRNGAGVDGDENKSADAQRTERAANCSCGRVVITRALGGGDGGK